MLLPLQVVELSFQLPDEATGEIFSLQDFLRRLCSLFALGIYLLLVEEKCFSPKNPLADDR